MTTASAAGQCAQALLAATKQKVHVVYEYRAALEYLREHEVAVIVFDESSMSSDLGDSLDLLKHSGAAIPVRVNFAVHSQERITLEVKEALRRLQRERVVAQRAARGELSSQFTGEVTAILMASQLALSAPSLPGRVREKIEEVCRVAERLRDRLKPAA